MRICSARTIATCLRNELRKTVFRAYLLLQLFWDQIFPYIHVVLDGNIPKRLGGLDRRGDLSYGQPSLEENREKSSPFLLFGSVVAPKSQLRVGPHRTRAWGQSEQLLPSPHHVPIAPRAVTDSLFSPLQVLLPYCIILSVQL